MALVPPVPTPQPALMQSVSPATKCWRLVFDANKKVVISLFEATGEMKTSNGMFISEKPALEGQQECLDFVKEQGLSLMILPPNMRFAPQPTTAQRMPVPQVPVKKQ